MALTVFHVTFNIPDVECGGGFYVRSLVNDIGKGRHEKNPMTMQGTSVCVSGKILSFCISQVTRPVCYFSEL